MTRSPGNHARLIEGEQSRPVGVEPQVRTDVQGPVVRPDIGDLPQPRLRGDRLAGAAPGWVAVDGEDEQRSAVTVIQARIVELPGAHEEVTTVDVHDRSRAEGAHVRRPGRDLTPMPET